MVVELQPGDPRKVGPYWLLGRLGSGGMGRVFLARSPGGRQVAVKVVRAELAEQADFRIRFAREVAAARTVSGLFTAPVVDADLDGPVPWLATAYVAGPSLADAVTNHGPLPVTSVLALAAGLAEGLGAIHAAGIVHRDLKPSNVLLAEDGPRIIDFGISRAAQASMLTGTGLVVGSPGFMSPEQAEGGDIGPPSDVFSLGAVLTFAATGEGPFGTGSIATLAYRVVHTPPATGDLPAGLRPLVERCMAKDPGQRPATGQLLAELDTAHPAAGWLPAPITQAFPLHAPPDPAPAGAAAPEGPPARPVTEFAAPSPPPPPDAPAWPATATAAPARAPDAAVAQPQPGGTGQPPRRGHRRRLSTSSDLISATPPPPPAGSPVGPPHSEDDDDRRRGAAVLITWRKLLGALIALVLVGAGVGAGLWLNRTSASAGEVFLQPANSAGSDPFTPNVGINVPVPGNVSSALKNGSSSSGAIRSYSGDSVGLYGGTRSLMSCNPQQMIRYLEANPAKAAAWAAAEEISTSKISSYISGLTPMTLRYDTRVTNHGFVNGRANSIQEILQAGQAVLVDSYSVPRARCYCGNPLTPPISLALYTYGGQRWAEFSPRTVIVVQKSTTVINNFTLIDNTTGAPFNRPARTTGPQDGLAKPSPNQPTMPGLTLPLNRWVTAADTPTARYYLAAAAGADGRLYAFGGMQEYAPSGPGSDRVTDTVESYDPAENIWRTEAPMPTPRCCLAAVGARDGDIYVIGGESESNLTEGGSNVPLDTVEVYSPDAGTWRSAASLPVPLGDARAVEGADGRIYAIGESSENVGEADTFEIYTTQTNTWEVGPPMPTPRFRPLLAAAHDGRIYVIGGSLRGGDTGIVKVYDPATNKWSQAASMPGPLDETTAVTGPDGRIYIPGGQDTYAGPPVNTVYVYTPDTNTWAKTTPLPIARYSQTAALGPDKRIYVIGGDTGSTEQHSGITTRVDVLTSGSSGSPGQSSPPTAAAACTPTALTNAVTAGQSQMGGDLAGWQISWYACGSGWAVAAGRAPSVGYGIAWLRETADGRWQTSHGLDGGLCNAAVPPQCGLTSPPSGMPPHDLLVSLAQRAGLVINGQGNIGPPGSAPVVSYVQTVAYLSDGRQQAFMSVRGAAQIQSRYQISPNGPWTVWVGFPYPPTTAGVRELHSGIKNDITYLYVFTDGGGNWATQKLSTNPNDGWTPYRQL